MGSISRVSSVSTTSSSTSSPLIIRVALKIAYFFYDNFALLFFKKSFERNFHILTHHLFSEKRASREETAIYLLFQDLTKAQDLNSLSKIKKELSFLKNKNYLLILNQALKIAQNYKAHSQIINFLEREIARVKTDKNQNKDFISTPDRSQLSTWLKIGIFGAAALLIGTAVYFSYSSGLINRSFSSLNPVPRCSSSTAFDIPSAPPNYTFNKPIFQSPPTALPQRFTQTLLSEETSLTNFTSYRSNCPQSFLSPPPLTCSIPLDLNGSLQERSWCQAASSSISATLSLFRNFVNSSSDKFCPVASQITSQSTPVYSVLSNEASVPALTSTLIPNLPSPPPTIAETLSTPIPASLTPRPEISSGLTSGTSLGSVLSNIKTSLIATAAFLTFFPLLLEHLKDKRRLETRTSSPTENIDLILLELVGFIVKKFSSQDKAEERLYYKKLDTVQAAGAINQYVGNQTLLLYACELGCLVEFCRNLILIRRANPKLKGRDGCSTLHYAAKNGNLDLVQFLTDHEVEINAVDIYNRTPLDFAEEYKHQTVIDYLKAHGAKKGTERPQQPKISPSSSSQSERTELDSQVKTQKNTPSQNEVYLHTRKLELFTNPNPTLSDVQRVVTTQNINELFTGHSFLHYACQNNWSIEICRYLLATLHANVNLPSRSNATALHFAAENGNLELVKLLEQNQADLNAVDIFGNSVLDYAIKSKKEDLVQYLKQKGARSAKGSKDLAALAQPKPSLSIPSPAQTLQSPPPTTSVSTVTTAATRDSSSRSITQQPAPTLVRKDPPPATLTTTSSQKKEEPKKKASSPLSIDRSNIGQSSSATIVSFEIISLCYKTDPTLQEVQQAMEKMKDINSLIDGQPLLNYACRNNWSFEICKHLLSKNPNPNIKGWEGLTPLHYAARNGNLDLVMLLTESQADLSSVDSKGKSPLHYAAESGNLLLLKFLIKEKANLSAVDIGGRLAIHSAASKGHLECVQFLMEEHQCDVNAKDAHNKTVLDYAKESTNGSLVKYLETKGAKSNSSTFAF